MVPLASPSTAAPSTAAQTSTEPSSPSPLPRQRFPTGAYHSVLPLNVTGYQSSIGCYHGTVSQTLMAQAYKRHCDMTTYQPGPKRKVSLPTDQPAKATTTAYNKDKMDMPMNMSGMSGM